MINFTASIIILSVLGSIFGLVLCLSFILFTCLILDDFTGSTGEEAGFAKGYACAFLTFNLTITAIVGPYFFVFVEDSENDFEEDNFKFLLVYFLTYFLPYFISYCFIVIRDFNVVNKVSTHKKITYSILELNANIYYFIVFLFFTCIVISNIIGYNKKIFKSNNINSKSKYIFLLMIFMNYLILSFRIKSRKICYKVINNIHLILIRNITFETILYIILLSLNISKKFEIVENILLFYVLIKYPINIIVPLNIDLDQEENYDNALIQKYAKKLIVGLNHTYREKEYLKKCKEWKIAEKNKGLKFKETEDFNHNCDILDLKND